MFLKDNVELLGELEELVKGVLGMKTADQPVVPPDADGED